MCCTESVAAWQHARIGKPFKAQTAFKQSQHGGRRADWALTSQRTGPSGSGGMLSTGRRDTCEWPDEQRKCRFHRTNAKALTEVNKYMSSPDLTMTPV